MAGEDLVFLPLGGVGEIGMNLGLYGYGPPHARSWLVVDFGIAFAGPDLPGVDVIFPDIRFLEEERRNIAGIVITHAHEDHFGALIDLWPRLGVPVHATAFTAGLLASKRDGEAVGPPVPVTVVKGGDRVRLGPFEVEFIPVAHSIPEPMALAIRTPLGTVLHTGDWKLDPTPVLGPPTDAARLKAIGDEGVLALVCDSTNAHREGVSPSETDVAAELAAIVREAPGRVVFTTFASNVARLRSVALAAAAAGRDVVLVGRALRRVADVAEELGYLRGLPPLHDAEAFEHLPRGRAVALVTGSQGEPRAALARIAEHDHPQVRLDRGDIVVFSSRVIPGNEREVNRIVNALITDGIRVITDRDRLVHVSGHPRRGELAEMYDWVRPTLLLPVHGEPFHMAAQAEFARRHGIARVLATRDGGMVRLAPDAAEAVDEIGAGRLYRDGMLIGDAEAVGVPERRRLAFAGHVAAALILDHRGQLVQEPDVELTGLPELGGDGRPMLERVLSAVQGTLESIPRPRRRDPEVVREAVRRAIRAAVRETWGKKPLCTVFVAVV
jgi:ribonuclease J